MKNNTLIFGDSYSTFKGYDPEGYAEIYTKYPLPYELDFRMH